MVRHQGPCIEEKTGLHDTFSKQVKEKPAIFGAVEYDGAVDAA